MEAYKKFMWVVTGVLILLVVTMLVYFFLVKGNGETGPQQEKVVEPPVSRVEKPAVKPHPQQAIPLETPGTEQEPVDFKLNASDEPVRELAQGISAHPDFRGWLKSKNLVRRLVAVVENVSNGVSPGTHLQFLRPRGEFRVVRRDDDTIVLDPRSYIRYQPVAVALVSIETQQAVKMYRQLLPVIEEAYAELGYPGKEFKSSLSRALDVLISTPVVDGDVFMSEKVTTYGFADPNLEGLNEVQKHLIRTGPANTRMIKAKIRELKAALKSRGLL